MLILSLHGMARLAVEGAEDQVVDDGDGVATVLRVFDEASSDLEEEKVPGAIEKAFCACATAPKRDLFTTSLNRTRFGLCHRGCREARGIREHCKARRDAQCGSTRWSSLCCS